MPGHLGEGSRVGSRLGWMSGRCLRYTRIHNERSAKEAPVGFSPMEKFYHRRGNMSGRAIEYTPDGENIFPSCLPLNVIFRF